MPTGIPFTRAKTYAAGVTEVESQTQNALQDESVFTQRLLRGGDFLLRDDFQGNTLNLSKWLAGTGATFAADNANDGYGTVTHSPVSGAYTPFKSVDLPIGVRDFHFATRLRLAHNSSGTNIVSIGLRSATGTEECYLQWTQPGTWKALVGGAAAHDLAIAENATHRLFEIIRKAGVVTFVLDGIDLYSTNFASNIVQAHVQQDTTSASGGTVPVVDLVSLYVPRVSLAMSGGASSTSRAYSGEAVMATGGSGAGADYTDVVLSPAFPTGVTDYRIHITQLVSDGNPAAWYVDSTTITEAGFRIIAVEQFNGKFRWDVNK